MTDALRTTQTGVARGMGIGIGLTAAATIIGLTRGYPAPIDDRLWTLGIAALVLGAWVAAGVADVARRRFFSTTAIDGAIDGGAGDPGVETANAILRNTVEQALVAFLAYAALALLAEGSRLPTALFLALFSAGRLLFWTGYRDGAEARALGFALSFYPSIVGLGIAAASLV